MAQGPDPVRAAVVAAARLVPEAVAGVVFHRNGACEPMPGLELHPLLEPGSPVVSACRDRISGRSPFSSFLWPHGGREAPDSHVRVTVLAVSEEVSPGTTAVALLSPATDLHGLTPRELEVLGLLVEGCSNQEIARALVIAARTVAVHLEHVLVKLDAPTRTLAAVRAERDGLFVPTSSFSHAAPHSSRRRDAVAPAVDDGAGALPREPTASTGDQPPTNVTHMTASRDHDVVLRSPHASAVLDENGYVVAVNHAWTAFSTEPSMERRGVGANYVDVCRAAMEQGAPAADAAHARLTAVLSGQRLSGSIIYPCAAPMGLRWFRGEFFATPQPGHVGVRHVDVTDQVAPHLGPGFDELLEDSPRTLTEAGLILALQELFVEPSHAAVVVIVTELDGWPDDADNDDRVTGASVLEKVLNSGVEIRAVGRLPHAVLAVVVTATDPHAAMRNAEALIRAASGTVPARGRQWGLAARSAADDASSLLSRARRSLLRSKRNDRQQMSIDDAAERSSNLHLAAAALVDAVANYDGALARGLPMIALVELDGIVQRAERDCVSAASSWP